MERKEYQDIFIVKILKRNDIGKGSETGVFMQITWKMQGSVWSLLNLHKITRSVYAACTPVYTFTLHSCMKRAFEEI